MSLVEHFRSWPASRQIAAVAAAFLVICALSIAAYFAFFSTQYRVLFANLRTADAATIVAELAKKKLPYRLQDGGTTILAPSKDVDATRLDIMSEDLPLKGTVGFELFNKSDMGLTEFAQKINYQRALQGELTRTIMSLDFVDTARVHLSLPDPTIFRDDKRAPKASVTLVPRTGKALNTSAINGIQRLVAAAVPDLQTDNVVVLDDQGNVVSGSIQAASTSQPAALQEQQSIQNYYASKVKKALERDFPTADVEVTILSRIDPDGVSDPAAIVEGWTPNARRFGLGVAISQTRPLSESEQMILKTLALAAIGPSADVADNVTFPAAPAGFGALNTAVDPLSTLTAKPAAIASQATSNGAKTPPSLGSASSFWIGIGVAALIPLIFLAGFLANFRQSRSRKLNEAEREAYVERFKTLLAEGDHHVSSA